MDFQLMIFVFLTVISARLVLDDLIFMIKRAPARSQFSGFAHNVGWLILTSSVFYIMNGMKYFQSSV